ncbi:MAG: phospholipid carrier-dependent glycosyltransferase, partial [Terrimicrobiaceae bacterium]|nr:phospholipid carrier-dependent glycosyltransferase [Terrimicrobiaceae bacterium]
MSKIGAGAGLLGLAAALGIYVLAGLMKVPFHPDEAMQLHMSRDFDRLLAEGPLALVTRPPYEVDSDDFLRILNGSIHRHVVGALRTALGLGPELLPPAPGWDWRYDVRANRQIGFFPKPELLVVGRLASAIFLALAGAVALLLGRALGGWSIGAGFAPLLMAHPVVLLNGRRALQEGSMLLFGLLAVLAAALLAKRMAEGGRPHPALWLFFAVASGLCLASKHPGLCFVLSGA